MGRLVRCSILLLPAIILSGNAGEPQKDKDRVAVKNIPIILRYASDIAADTLRLTLKVSTDKGDENQVVSIPYRTSGNFPGGSPILFVKTQGGLQGKKNTDDLIEWNGIVETGGRKIYARVGETVEISLEFLQGNNVLAHVIRKPALIYNIASRPSVNDQKEVIVRQGDTVRLAADLALEVEAGEGSEFLIFQANGDDLGDRLDENYPARKQGKNRVVGSFKTLQPGTYFVHSIVEIASHGTGSDRAVVVQKTIAVSAEPAKIVVLGEKLHLKAELIPFRPKDYTADVLVGINQDRSSAGIKHFPEEARLKVEVLSGNPPEVVPLNATITISDISAGGTIYDGKFGATKLPQTLPIVNGHLQAGQDIIDNALQLFSISPFARKSTRARIRVAFTGDALAEGTAAFVEVDQWVDFIGLGGASDPRAGISAGQNSIPDWIDVNVKYTEEQARGEVKTVIGKIEGYTIGKSENEDDNNKSIMSVSINKTDPNTIIRINEESDKLRPKQNFTPRFSGSSFKATKDPFVSAYIHEGRHAYQKFEVLETGNDKDNDFLPRTFALSTPNFPDPDPIPGNKKIKRTIIDKNDDSPRTVSAPSLKAEDAKLEGRKVSQNQTLDPPLVFIGRLKFSVNDDRLRVLEVEKLSISIDGIEVSIAVEGGVPAPGETVLRGESKVRVGLTDASTGTFDATYQIAENDGFSKDSYKKAFIKVTYFYPDKTDSKYVLEMDAYRWTEDNQ
ncbi:MAG: hypothetical protein M5U26_16210 [Planctomycetota bacterium]|nr:hypothetical protein [Planctomycetota bacterium]